MKKQKVTAVFDIGKTNKKFFLFDSDFKEVYKEYIQFDEIKDEDGFPTENLEALRKWLKSVFHHISEIENYEIDTLNFSAYGASFVHIDEHGNLLTPLYNYLKPVDEDLLTSFYKKYGPEIELSAKTGSPKSGMLNSGFQLYWLKHTQPEVFKKIKYSLHLPQYLSYVFTGIPISEYTSIGCHTILWDYTKNDYHDWVYKEEIYKILPPIASAKTTFIMNHNGKCIKTGIGIHDSSSALIPYIRSSKKPFILISTGTWSVALNPFSKTQLTQKDILNETFNYMRINGKAVKSSKLLLGNEYKYQITQLSKYYGIPPENHKYVKFNINIFNKISGNFKYCFKWKYFKDINMPQQTRISHTTYQEAYHQLMMELVKLQLNNIALIKGKDASVTKLFVDGGFSDNDVFIKLLSHYLEDMELWSANSSLGSALGAAIVLSDNKLNFEFLKKNYVLKKHTPFVVNQNI
ncbi:FGGY-family carbohydrate kinase [Abyssalbus ytuae]|uniref:FGGY family carbohydrate kinase n=1 Tax=Abyssalbus ytuae TaxID=2926907 RepID=A0A9E7CZR1_9FLAO|nr:FGGY family carbohydrate kinase [Abyssalbus ytuae]UOB17785.1 FGGY family carbohydrate kinase [Abyssalbus ytuae]